MSKWYYIPSNSSLDVFKTYFDSLEVLYINYLDPSFIFAEDFNLPGLYWENNDLHANIIGSKSNKSDVLE